MAGTGLKAGQAEDSSSVYVPRSECSNYNSFLNGAAMDSLMTIADTVYPSGIVMVNPTRWQETGGLDHFVNMMGLGSDYTFELAKSSVRKLNGKVRYYSRYQQYYKNVLVEGGGFTVAARSNHDPDDPCLEAFLVSMYLSTDFSLSALPSVGAPALKSILENASSPAVLIDTSYFSYELLISHNLESGCAQHLAWKVDYRQDGEVKTTWVNARTGNILKTILVTPVNLSADTETYGPVELDDSFDGTFTSLITDDGRVSTYDFGNQNAEDIISTIPWNAALIPRTLGGDPIEDEWTDEAPEAVYQAHLVVSTCLPIYTDLGFHFNEILAASTTGFNGAALFDQSTLNQTYIIFGRRNGATTALYDVAAHELAHVAISDLGLPLGGAFIGTRTLHEGIADMLATYIESLINENQINWVIGGDEEEIANWLNRDLSNPAFDCFENISTSAQVHNRSVPLSHWFYLITTGDSSLGISSLGIELALDIVLNSIGMLGADSDYPDFRNAVLGTVEAEFGLCSDEYTSVANAWNHICVGYTVTCPFEIAGLPSGTWCEENENNLILSISGALPGTAYKWIFPSQWTVAGVSQGTNYVVANSIVVTNIPKYTYYPRTFNVYVSSYAAGPAFNAVKRIEIEDCDGDDPNCEDIYTPIELSTPSSNKHIEELVKHSLPLSQDVDFYNVRVFDVLGRLRYKGTWTDFQQTQLPNIRDLIFCAFFDRNGRFIRTESIIRSF